MNNIVPSVKNTIVNENGEVFDSIRSLAKRLGVSRTQITTALKKNQFVYRGHTYRLRTALSNAEGNVETNNTPDAYSEDYQEFLKFKDIKSLPYENYNIKLSKHKNGSRYAVALFSDAHIEETVDPANVLGMNEYNIDIAEERITKYFSNLASCLERDKVEDLIFASLGDTISGYIHDELAQNNGLSPLEATYKAQSLLVSGLKFLCENTKLRKIQFIGIVGNHSRTTKKIQHANGYKLSYEYLMYLNVRDQVKALGLPVDFYIPESEIAVVNTDDGKRFLFMHGFQIKGSGNGTVCGIYPSLNRLSMKLERNFKQDRIFIGHFHSCISIPNAVVNGSIIGYNSFSLTNGFAYEEPAQMYICYDSALGGDGELLARKIYCK